MRLVKKLWTAVAPYLFPVGMLLIALVCGSMLRVFVHPGPVNALHSALAFGLVR